jgi:Rod binding domain-containing protein
MSIQSPVISPILATTPRYFGSTPASSSPPGAYGLGSSKESPEKDSPEKIRQAATDFEALLIAQMLRLARESGGGMTGDSDEQDETNSTMIELGEQQLAQALSNSGGLGLAKMVVAGLTNHANR